MLPQFGLTEFLFIAIVALIVVGPKDLPVMMRQLGRFVAKARSMAREFQSAFEDIAKQTELEELRKEIEDLKRNNAMTEAADELRAVEADINKSVLKKEAEDLADDVDPAPEPAPKPGPKGEPA